MTCREKLEIEYPENISKQYAGDCKSCPHDYGYVKNNYCVEIYNSCEKCWNREVEEMEEKEMQNDNVNHPSHYTSGEIECIDAIKASMTPEEFRGFLKGNSMKYIWRYRQKGKPIEDLRKAEWYLKKLIEEVEGHE